jgi:serine/threonine protein kinase
MLKPESGTVIAGRYRLEQVLGSGGMGAVWSAEHLELRAKVAVKLIVQEQAADLDVQARFLREARSAAALRSPHVVQILDHGVDDGVAFMVMEELQGMDLAERLRQEQRLTPALTAMIVTHVARAVTRAHDAGLVHRDLKPANIFLVENDEEILAKVLDFGIAKVPWKSLAGARTDTGALLGSPFYMSPEQAYGRSDIDGRSDLWSLGVIAFECLVGRRPFQSDAIGEQIMLICNDPVPVPSAVAPVPAGFDEWFARATDRNRDRRFQSAKELAVALRAVLLPGDASLLLALGSDPPTAAAPAAALESQPTLGGSGEVLTPAAAPSSPASLGGTTTAATSSDRRRSSASSPKLVQWPRRVGPALGVAVVGGAILWSLHRKGSTESSPTAAPAAPSPTHTSALAAPSPSLEPPRVEPVVSAGAGPAALASADGSAALRIASSASATRARTHPAAKGSSSARRAPPPAPPAPTSAPAGRAINPLDKRF